MIEEIGRALYGRHFQGELAKDLEVSDRTFRRWIAGTADIPDGVYKDLANLLKKRMELIKQIQAKIGD